MEAQGELLGDGRCEDSSKAPSVLHAAASRVHSPLERRAEVLTRTEFFYVEKKFVRGGRTSASGANGSSAGGRVCVRTLEGGAIARSAGGGPLPAQAPKDPMQGVRRGRASARTSASRAQPSAAGRSP
jgi:hypothetical protein